VNDFIRMSIITPSEEIKPKFGLREVTSKKLKLGQNITQSTMVDL